MDNYYKTSTVRVKDMVVSIAHWTVDNCYFIASINAVSNHMQVLKFE